jgi:uncharacterized membrane protein
VSEGPAAASAASRREALLAVVLVALGALARLRAAHAPFLTPDEMLHLQIAGEPTLAKVYRASLDNAHPPLFFLLLHPWKNEVRSEWALRLLPVLLGTLALPAAWLWARRLLGSTAGLIALALFALLPAVVLVTSEVRGYALLLATTAAALAALERGVDEGSAAALAAFGVFGVLALLSHYAAFRILAAALVFAGIRLFAQPAARRLRLAAAASGAALAAVALALLRTHVARLRGGPLEAEARATWLRESYLGAGEGAAAFLLRQTVSLFHYLFSATVPALVALALYVAALVLLARGRAAAALLLGVPLALAALGGLLGVYPYGGTRHSIDLLLVIGAGAAFGLARATGERAWVAAATAAALAPAAFLAAG